MKKGFTLAELLIALGIIGVVAALAGPAITGVMPDKTKSSYIKTYNVVSNKVQEITSDRELYWSDGACVGIGCTQKPTELNSVANYNASKKLPTLLYNRLSTSGNISYNNNESTFTTTDGTVWTFKVASNLPTNYAHSLEVDFNSGNGCIYSPSECSKPKKFVFAIKNNGSVVPADSMGRVFLRNALELKVSEQDKTLAKSDYVKNSIKDKSYDTLDEVKTEISTDLYKDLVYKD